MGASPGGVADAADASDEDDTGNRLSNRPANDAGLEGCQWGVSSRGSAATSRATLLMPEAKR
jgi:hypothetical protein